MPFKIWFKFQQTIASDHITSQRIVCPLQESIMIFVVRCDRSVFDETVVYVCHPANDAYWNHLIVFLPACRFHKMLCNKTASEKTEKNHCAIFKNDPIMFYPICPVYTVFSLAMPCQSNALRLRSKMKKGRFDFFRSHSCACEPHKNWN